MESDEILKDGETWEKGELLYGTESELKNHQSDFVNSEGIWPDERIETKIVY